MLSSGKGEDAALLGVQRNVQLKVLRFVHSDIPIPCRRVSCFLIRALTLTSEAVKTVFVLLDNCAALTIKLGDCMSAVFLGLWKGGEGTSMLLWKHF